MKRAAGLSIIVQLCLASCLWQALSGCRRCGELREVLRVEDYGNSYWMGVRMGPQKQVGVSMEAPVTKVIKCQQKEDGGGGVKRAPASEASAGAAEIR